MDHAENANFLRRPPVGRRDWSALAGAALILLAVAAAYHNSLQGPLVLDDEVAIRDNRSIRDLARPADVLFPPPAVFTSGRPLLNFSFALNHAAGGGDVRGYHVTNLAIHALAALAFFGVLRRALRLPRLRTRFGPAAWPCALVAAVLWAVHPLATSSVTYLSQRAESLMGLFFLWTLYGFVRAVAAPPSGAWWWFSGLSCLAGMATKETMAAAPVFVLLFDRALVGTSFERIVRERGGYYAGLATTWLALAGLMLTSHPASRGVGFGLGPEWWEYAAAEMRVVWRYAWLAAWPHPLVFDYGAELLAPRGILSALGGTALALAVAGLWAGRRRHPALVCAIAGFFLLLAPTSSVVPIAVQPMAENRTYLPLAALVAAGAGLCWRVAGRPGMAALGCAALSGVLLTGARNSDYHDAIRLWTDTVAKAPGNSRAHNNLGLALSDVPNRRAEALAHLRRALALNPSFAEAHNNLGRLLADEPATLPEAIAHFEAALRAVPSFAAAHTNLANALSRQPGRAAEALAHYETAVRLRPENPQLHYNLAGALAAVPARRADAIAHYRKALELDRDYTDAYYNLGNLLAGRTEQIPEAIACYQAALRLNLRFAAAHYNLANALAELPGRLEEAIHHYRSAVALEPRLMAAHNNLAVALYRAGRLPEAIAQLETALRIDPANAEARNNLRILRTQLSR